MQTHWYCFRHISTSGLASNGYRMMFFGEKSLQSSDIGSWIGPEPFLMSPDDRFQHFRFRPNRKQSPASRRRPTDPYIVFGRNKTLVAASSLLRFPPYLHFRFVASHSTRTTPSVSYTVHEEPSHSSVQAMFGVIISALIVNFDIVWHFFRCRVVKSVSSYAFMFFFSVYSSANQCAFLQYFE